ncbi:MAG: VOC family protein [Planctomycetota bacterium]|nr:VOC family protein [Planctomycetota bacterium]
MAITRMAHLALRCSDLERSRDFYTNVIGFEFHAWRPQGDSMDITDGHINITLLPYQGTRPGFVEGDEYIHFGVVVDDLQKIWDRSIQWGAENTKGDVKARTETDLAAGPGRSFKLLDPDGNVIDVTANRDEWRCVKYPD